MEVFYNDEPSCVILIMWEICNLKRLSVIKGGKFNLYYRFYWHQIIPQDSFTFQKYQEFDREPIELVSRQNYPCISHPFPLFNNMGPPPYHPCLCSVRHGITSGQETTTSPVCVEGHFCFAAAALRPGRTPWVGHVEALFSSTTGVCAAVF